MRHLKPRCYGAARLNRGQKRIGVGTGSSPDMFADDRRPSLSDGRRAIRYYRLLLLCPYAKLR